ncbi:hypothetical protein C1646_775341 [Rhizophagus diaphanus]|nr:hypothetical protein C1646_775341 [Rhizophagus diaphanus] [Rhizophagus sp. MUCL 43196]
MLKSILCFFNSTTTNKDDDDNINSDDDWNNWESEVEDVMNDDDIITVDENENEINGEGNANIEIISPVTINQTGRKRKPCLRLRSDLIAKYVDRTLAYYGGARRVEVIAKEMYSGKFPYKFTRKKLKSSQKPHRLTIPKPAPENLKFMPKFYFENNSLKKHLQNQDLRKIWSIVKNNYDTNIWIILADKAHKGAFKEKPVFTELCEVMIQAAIRSFSTRAFDLFRQNLEGRTIQNIRYVLLI